MIASLDTVNLFVIAIILAGLGAVALFVALVVGFRDQSEERRR